MHWKTLCVAALATLITWASPAKAERPNVLVFLLDDLSPYALQHQAPTPAIDAIARRGVTFTNGYSTASVCRPSRAGLLTGGYQQEFGIYRNPDESLRDPVNDPDPLPFSAVTMAENFKSGGYSTAIYGKWHLGYSRALSPQAQGFEDGVYYAGGGHPYLSGPLSDINGAVVYFRGGLSEYLGGQAANYIRSHTDKPWFVYVALPTPHKPYQATAEELARCDGFPGDKTFCGMLVGGDRAVQQVMDAAPENTLVFLTADNGCASGGQCNDGGLRGTKGKPWEGGTKVPYMVSYPGHLPAGTVSHEVVSGMDIMPTALDAAGIEPLRNLDGVSLLNLTGGKAAVKDTGGRVLVWASTPGRLSARKGPWKVLFEGKRWQLYNVDNDPDESNDVAGAHPEIVNELAAAARARAQTFAPPKN